MLIVGPGMDLAPRTGFRDTPPESYQPWAVIDALLAMGLSRLDDLEVTAADINPRVVDHLRRSRAAPPTLSLTTDIAEAGGVSFSPEYRDYFARLGQHLSASGGTDRGRQDPGGHLLQVDPRRRVRRTDPPRRAARHRDRAARRADHSIW